MEKPLVSVILPAYKAETYISNALNSIAAQTYSNWELIVVEDAWRDRTEEIVREFACILPNHRIEFIRHTTNQGLAATRNTAIQLAKGKYFAFLDHDDIWRSDHLKESVKALEEQNADIAYSTVLMFQDGTNEELEPWGPTIEEIKNFPVSLYERNYITPSATLVKSSAVKEIGLFDDKIRSCEDYDYWIRMAKSNFKFIHIQDIHCLYRKHLSALTANHQLMVETMLYVMKKHKNWNVVPKEIRTQKIVSLYSDLGKQHLHEKWWKAARFFLAAWLHQPKNFYYAKQLIKVLVP